MFVMSGLAETIELRSARDAEQAYHEAFESDRPVELDEATAMLLEQLSTPVDGEDSGAVMAGGAGGIGAALLERVGEVQGLRHLGGPGSRYLTLAVASAHDPMATAELKDPHMAVSVGWLNSQMSCRRS